MSGAPDNASEFGASVHRLLDIAYAGIYHEKGAMKADYSDNNHVRICVNDHDGSEYTTFDSDTLTRLVLLSHDAGIRFGVSAAAHGWLWLDFVRVDKRNLISDHQPTIWEALDKLGIERPYRQQAQP